VKGRKLYHIVLLVFWSPLLFAQQNFYATDSIREIRLYFEDPHWQTTLDSLFLNEGTIGRLEATVKIDGSVYHHCGVRYKGYSSWNSGELKNPFNIELDYKIKNQNHLGFSKLKLSNVIHDPSFIREALSYEIVRTYMPAPAANFARLFVNDTLIGLYTNVEAVDLPLIKRTFPDDKGVFFKGDPETLEFPFGENANLAHSHGNDSNNYMPYYKLESDFGWSQIYRFIILLDNQPDSLQSIMNIDQMLWMHALNYVMVNLDSYIGYAQNYYMYQDQHGRFNPFIWDLNMSFASFRETDGSTNFQGLTIDKAKKLDPLQHLNFSISPRPLMKKLFAEKRLKLQYLAHMRTILDEYFATGKYLNRAYELQQMIDADVQADTNKFYSYTDFLNNVDSTVGGTAGMKLYPGLRDLMEARMDYLESYPGFQGAPVIEHMMTTPTVQQGNWLFFIASVSNATTVNVYWRCASTDEFREMPMYDDGNHHDFGIGDGIYGGWIADITGPVVQWYYYAENDSAGAFLPPRAGRDYFQKQAFLLPGDLVINEVMMNNTATVKDQDGEFDPWIEILNTTNEKLSIGEHFIGPEVEVSNGGMLPDVSIEPHSYLIIWLDGDTSQSGIHVKTNISGTSGPLYLYDRGAVIIDEVRYELAPANKSFGRYPNGYGPFTYMAPSFGKNNFVPIAGMGQISIYPNPAQDILNVEGAGISGDAEIRVFNHLGQEVIRETAEIQNGTLLNQLNLSGLTGGVYLLRLSTSGRDYIQKFVKQ
jgi:hypothetical protein